MVLRAPETRYTSVGDTDVAYLVVGEGPPDLLFFNGLGSSIDLMWTSPEATPFFTRLGSVCRLIMFDRRGSGASDSVGRNSLPTWEDLSEDAGAVLDAVESQAAAILAISETGPMAILFAAMHPERVSGLALVNTYARYLVGDDYPIGASHEVIDSVVAVIRNGWGTHELARLAEPSHAHDVERLDRLARVQRLSATPRNAAAQYDYMLRNIDVRQVLPLIQVPTLVLHTRDGRLIPFEMGRYVADHVNGAKLVEIPGADYSWAGEHAAMIFDEVTEFLTGERPIEVERILATILFTDIVDSTVRASSLGDRSWRSLLDSHDRTIRDQLKRFRGKEINTTGDGFVMSFDGPARAIRCAQAIVEATRSLGIEVRVGLHTGECEVRGDDLGGLAVHIAARVSGLAGPAEILVSSTVKDLVMGSGIELTDRGEHELKGVPGPWRLFAVTG